MKKNQTIYKFVAIALPFFFLFLMEVFLRIIGYGENFNLFNRIKLDTGAEYLLMDADISKKYFKDNELRSDNQSDLFLKTKTDSTFRIFVQGASSAVGFPFYRGGSFSRMLKHRLSQTFPERNIEVINTAMTAVNSYTLWDLTDDIIRQDPDLVIIYAGHNEYYGALGVGSSSAFNGRSSLVRSWLKLKNYRFFQLFNNAYYIITGGNKNAKSSKETTLMEVMAKEQSIPYNSQMYHAGIHQFESNLGLILKKYNEHSIPVILSTVVSNEKDVKPFMSEGIPDNFKYDFALQGELDLIKPIAENNAQASYELGQYFLNHNQDSSKKYLRQAKELDLLRFRAPSKINEIIVDLGKEYHSILVDMEDIFLNNSELSVVGDELLSEHVHPNVEGYFVMADAFYEKIKELNLIGEWGGYKAFEEAFQDIPITKIDSVKGSFIIQNLKRSWPYDLSTSGARPVPIYATIVNPTYEQERAVELITKVNSWENIMSRSYQKYRFEGNFTEALRVAQSLIFEYPEKPDVYRMAGEMCLELGEMEKAQYYFFKCNKLEESGISANQLAAIYVRLKRIDLASATLLEAKDRKQVKKLDQIIKEEGQQR